jgi:hypothetical protein
VPAVVDASDHDADVEQNPRHRFDRHDQEPEPPKMGAEKKSAEQPAPEKRLSRCGVTDNPEERDQREEGKEPQGERRERKRAEADGRDGQNQDSSDVSGTSPRVDWDR